VIIAGALGGLAFLGYHATEKWAKGLKLARLGDFADVAEQIRRDVKGKLDDFIRDEENRDYTEYQYYQADDNVRPGQLASLRSRRDALASLRSSQRDRVAAGVAAGRRYQSLLRR